ncbi:hypothetical protein EDB86DRAFT_2834202 [Lactarius hatsudake]|nr:hypothetical protein EDB86DRAFT_2834202 [Lactarius hatsudake]
MSVSSLTLLALPVEIILAILEDCEYQEILACKLTCRRMYDTISGSISLRYLLELAANGMRDDHRSSLGKIQRLNLLAEHETAWRTLSWLDNTSIDTLDGWGEPVSVSGNIIAFRNAYAKPDASSEELLLLRAPSKLRNVQTKRWVVQLPHDTQDVCISSAQDLLVYRCGTKSFHFCSLSSGEKHPLVQHSGTFEATNSWRYRIGSMRVYGDSFAIASEQGLYISTWNWKSGEQESDFMASLQHSTFDFLDEHHILFPSSIDDSLYVYDARAMPPMNSRRRKSKGTHCFEISMPRFLGNHVTCGIDLRCNSLSAGQDESPASFHADPHQRMISLLITAGPNSTGAHGHSPREQCEMHVRASALLAWTKMHPAPPNASVVVPWSAWGPAAARVVVPRVDDTTLCASKSKFLGSGMRVITPPSSRSDGTSVVTVMDYHPARVFRGLQAEKHRWHNSHTCLTTPTQHGTLAQADPEWDNNKHGPRASTNSRSRSKSLPLPSFTSSAGVRGMSVTDVIKNLVFGGWNGPSQPKVRGTAARTAVKKLQFLEKDIPLPQELQFDNTRPVFDVLCEDAVMFYTLVPGRNTIQHAHWYTF